MTSKSEVRTNGGLENCAPDGDRASSGAQNHRDVPNFSSSHIWPQKVNLQVFSRIGKTMKKLYKFQIQTRNQHSCNTLMFAYRQVLKLPYLLMDWEAYNQFPALKQVRGVRKFFRRPSW